jgi:hypothetical protein
LVVCILYLACVGEVPDHFEAAVQQAKRPDVYFSSSGDRSGASDEAHTC